MSVELYKEVIGIIVTQPDLEAIAIEIAKSSPKAFVDAAHSLGIGDAQLVKNKFNEKVRKIDQNEGMIPAIKFVRCEKGFGLIDAKEYVESLRK